MATYYVRKTGNNASAGTSAGTAWQTITKALTTVTGGDTVYVGAGIYRETVTPTISPASAVNMIADVNGSRTGDAGRVVITGYTTDDKTAPSATATLNFGTRRFINLTDFCIYGSQSNALVGTLRDCTFTRCFFGPGNGSSGVAVVSLTGTVDTNAAVVFDSCWFFTPLASTITISMPTSAAADYDAGFRFKNSVFLGCGVALTTSGASAFKPGGTSLYNCTLYTQGTSLSTGGTNHSTSIPAVVYNSLIMSSNIGLSAGAAGAIVEDYNVIHAITARSSVTAGTNSISSRNYCPTLAMCDWMWGMQIRPFMMPDAGSPLLAFGAQAGGPTVDILGANRPAGGASLSYAVGAYERSNSGAATTSPVHGAGSKALQITGPGYHDFAVPVDAVSTTITIYGRYDSTHGATNKPQMQVLNGGECGVADATATMTAAADTWEALSLTFTPTQAGIVTVRLISRAAAGGGNAYFDD